jgi:hypothetical protein
VDVRSEILIIAAEDAIAALPTNIEPAGSRWRGGEVVRWWGNYETAKRGNGETATADNRRFADSPSRRFDSPAPGGQLAERVLQLRQSDVRYRRIQFEIRGGMVRLWGSRNQADNLFAMAQAVSRLPGVERVIVDH